MLIEPLQKVCTEPRRDVKWAETFKQQKYLIFRNNNMQLYKQQQQQQQEQQQTRSLAAPNFKKETLRLAALNIG